MYNQGIKLTVQDPSCALCTVSLSLSLSLSVLIYLKLMEYTNFFFSHMNFIAIAELCPQQSLSCHNVLYKPIKYFGIGFLLWITILVSYLTSSYPKSWRYTSGGFLLEVSYITYRTMKYFEFMLQFGLKFWVKIFLFCIQIKFKNLFISIQISV
jgi:hypothetical protein